MKVKHKRMAAVLLLFAMLVGVIPAAMASDTAQLGAESAVEERPIASGSESVENAAYASEGTEEDVPRSMDGETLTRDEDLLRSAEKASGGLLQSIRAMLASRASSNGTMGKSNCVSFAAYTSPTWYCNRYAADGSHAYGHYYYCSTISYHTINGEWGYCIERATRS